MTTRYLNSSTWGKSSSPLQSGHSTFFWLRDLERLILIAITSYSTGNHRSDRGKSPSGKAKKQRWSSRHHSGDPSVSWLHVETVSIKIMRRICDKGHPRQSPTPTGTKFELLLVMRTKLSPYRERTASNNGPSTPILPQNAPQDTPRGLG